MIEAALAFSLLAVLLAGYAVFFSRSSCKELRTEVRAVINRHRALEGDMTQLEKTLSKPRVVEIVRDYLLGTSEWDKGILRNYVHPRIDRILDHLGLEEMQPNPSTVLVKKKKKSPV